MIWHFLDQMSRNDMWFKRSDSGSIKSRRFEQWNETSIYVSIKHTHILLLSRRRCALRMLCGALFRVAISNAAVSASPPPSSSYVMMFSLISSSSTGDWVSRFCLRNDSESAATTIGQKTARKKREEVTAAFLRYMYIQYTDTFNLSFWLTLLIQSVLHWIHAINLFFQLMHSLRIEPMTLMLLGAILHCLYGAK